MSSGDDKAPRRSDPTQRVVSLIRFPALIGSIELGRQIGVGGMAVVYEGLDRGFTPARRVAVKLMDPSLSDDENFRARFEREASVVAEFRHDNIVHVYSSGEVDGAKYLVMEYLAGGTLAEKIEEGPLPVTEAIRIGTLLAEALSYAHARAVVHRDFKPGNVLITADGKPVLSDFGIAKPTLTTEQALTTRHPVVMGALDYMAPEQELGKPATDRADIYSFGVTMFEMLTGHLPELSERVLRDLSHSGTIRGPLEPISPRLAELICRCLLFDPLARPTAQDCVRALRELSAGLTALTTRQRRRIFVSSPSDVIAAREVAVQIIEKLAHEHARFFALEPYLWDYERMLAAGRFEDLLDPPSRFEAVVLILASRLGALLPARTDRREYRGMGGRVPLSGTEWVFEDALVATRERGVPELLIYRSQGSVEVSTRDAHIRQRQLTQIEALDGFWARYANDTTGFGGQYAYAQFQTLEEFSARFEKDLRHCVERWIKDLSAVERAASVRVWAKAPFRGLESYELEHAPIFFGRDEIIGAALLRLTANARAGRPFLLVLGASGSGKSSFVKAGMVARLLGPQRVPGVAFLRRVVFRPSDALGREDLFEALARRLTEHDAEGIGIPEILGSSMPVTEFARHLRAASAHPHLPIAMVLDHVSEVARGQGRMLHYEQGVLLLVIDQLEELFTREHITPEERASFVRLMSGLVRSGRVWIIATMRADFWHRAGETPELIRLADGDGRLDLLPATPSELSRMIRGPAEAAALHFETHPRSGIALNEVIAEAATGEPGVLPLLSYLLDQLYLRDIKEAGGDTLTYASYEALGGLKGAIAKRADAVLAALPTEVSQALRSVLFALVQTSTVEGGVERAVSRRAPLSEFPPGSPKHRLIEALLEPSTRLLVAEGGEGKAANVRLAHEALISEWQTAREYVAGNAEALKSRRMLEERYARWHSLARESEARGRTLFAREPGLLTDLDLSEAKRLLRDHRDELTPELVEYVERSSAQDRRRHRRAVHVASAVAAALGMLAIGAIYEAKRASVQSARLEVEAGAAKETAHFLVDLFRVADPSEARGNAITAREMLDKGAARVETELAKQPQIQATLMDTLGTVYMGLGLYGQAKPLLDLAVAKRRALMPAEPAELALSLSHTGDLLTQRAEYPGAETAYREAIALQKALPPDQRDDAGLARSLFGLGLELSKQGRSGEAERSLRDALALQKRLFPGANEDTARTLDALAYWTINERDLNEAVSMMQSAVAMQRALWGNQPYPDYADALNDLGLLLRSKSEYTESERLLRESLAMQRRLLGDKHPNVAESLNNLALVLHLKGDLEGANSTYRQALAMQRELLGEVHPDVALTLYNLAAVMQDSGDLHGAVEATRESLRIFRALFPGDNPDVARAMNGLGYMLTESGDYSAADPYLQDALKMRRRLFGEAHPQVASSLVSVAILQVAMRDYPDALLSARAAKEMFTSALSASNWKTAVAQSVNGAALTGVGKYAEAERELLQAYTLLSQDGAALPTYRTLARHYLETLYRSWGRPEDAIRYGDVTVPASSTSRPPN